MNRVALARLPLIIAGALGALGYGLFARGFLARLAGDDAVSAITVFAQLLTDSQFATFWILPTMLFWTNVRARNAFRLSALLRHGSRRRTLAAFMGQSVIDSAAILLGVAIGALIAVVGLPWGAADHSGDFTADALAWLASSALRSALVPLLAIALTVLGLVAIATTLTAWGATPELRAPGLALSSVAVWLWAAAAQLFGGASGLLGPNDLLLIPFTDGIWIRAIGQAATCAALGLLSLALVARSDER